MKTLPIPFLSQLDPTNAGAHHNDCGAACACMLLKAYDSAFGMSVNQFYDLANPVGDAYLSASQIMLAMRQCGLEVAWRTYQDMARLYTVLCDRRPAILLINYGILVDAGLTERTDFRGAHFVVATGLDIENATILDPYRTFTGPEIPVGVLDAAWAEARAQNNPARSMLVPEYGIGAAQPTAIGRVRILETMKVRSGPGTNYPDTGRLTVGQETPYYEETHDHWLKISPMYARWIYGGNPAWVQRL